jgi:hypothetical protein
VPKKKKKSHTKKGKEGKRKKKVKKIKSACILFSPTAEILLLVELGPRQI